MTRKNKTVMAILSTAIMIGGLFPVAANASVQAPQKNSNVTTYYFNGVKVNSEQEFRALLHKYSNRHNGQNVVTKPEQKPEQPQVQKPAPEQKPEQPPVQQPAPEQKPDTNNNSQAGQNLSQFEQEVVSLTNAERAKAGLKALQIDATLSKSAHEKSRDMSVNGYFSHTSPTYGSPFDMMKKYGITYKSAGENIAQGQRTPKEVVNAWMNSAGHRANIMNASFTHIGVGYVEKDNVWTQQFIGK